MDDLGCSYFLGRYFCGCRDHFLAYLLNTYALKDLSPSVVSMYIYTQPFLATLFAVFLGKDSLTPTKILSAVFIIAGVYLVSMKSSTVVKK